MKALGQQRRAVVAAADGDPDGGALGADGGALGADGGALGADGQRNVTGLVAGDREFGFVVVEGDLGHHGTSTSLSWAYMAITSWAWAAAAGEIACTRSSSAATQVRVISLAPRSMSWVITRTWRLVPSGRAFPSMTMV